MEDILGETFQPITNNLPANERGHLGYLIVYLGVVMHFTENLRMQRYTHTHTHTHYAETYKISETDRQL